MLWTILIKWVHLKLGHRFHALLKFCSDHDDTVPLIIGQNDSHSSDDYSHQNDFNTTPLSWCFMAKYKNLGRVRMIDFGCGCGYWQRTPALKHRQTHWSSHSHSESRQFGRGLISSIWRRTRYRHLIMGITFALFGTDYEIVALIFKY